MCFILCSFKHFRKEATELLNTVMFNVILAHKHTHKVTFTWSFIQMISKFNEYLALLCYGYPSQRIRSLRLVAHVGTITIIIIREPSTCDVLSPVPGCWPHFSSTCQFTRRVAPHQATCADQRCSLRGTWSGRNSNSPRTTLTTDTSTTIGLGAAYRIVRPLDF